MDIKIQVVIDGQVLLTQSVSRKTLDDEIYPILETESNKGGDVRPSADARRARPSFPWTWEDFQ